ncbi:transposase [Desulfopila sp. IMCC35008]|uniref:transposase n=1 Tax=Desulfopila sp. IMCC35008 TaxID=2653858 RepID=UPI0013D47B2C|nr:transposase [Desulfopila sp. IMCC35008]
MLTFFFPRRLNRSRPIVDRIWANGGSPTASRIPGIVVAIQIFGDYACWHPHLHAMVADGLFLESGNFFVIDGWYSNRMRGDRKRQLELAEKDR